MAIPTKTLVVAAIITLATGCTQPNPNAAPTYTCTPETGGTPFPCYQAQYDQYQKQNKLYTEAETVYRKYLAEEERIYRAGGTTTPTPVLLETTTGKYLENAMFTFRQVKASGGSVKGGDFELVWVRRQPNLAIAGSVATLKVCVDARSVLTKVPGDKARPGRVFEKTIYFINENSALKMAALDLTEVTSCGS